MIDSRIRGFTLFTALWLAAPVLRADDLSPAAAPEVDAFVQSLAGAWLGRGNDTPFGKMDFVALFEREADGSLHSRSALNTETYIDLRFWKDDAGRWMLTEEAGMEGMGVQSHDLVPAGRVAETGLYRWVHAERPEFLVIEVGVRGETLILETTLRGEPHVAFRLDRQPEELWAEIRQGLLAQAQQTPEEGYSIRDVVSVPPPARAALDAPADDPIAAARRAVADAPDDGAARLALAKALGAAIDADPANGPRYAFEMLESLTTAVELDPSLVEAYHWLVGYYLSAPAIAGGSVADAIAVAQRLAAIDPEGARVLQRQIAAHATDPEAAAGGDSR